MGDRQRKEPASTSTAAPKKSTAQNQPQSKAAAGPASSKGGKAPLGELTEEQKQEIKEAFELFDTDGSGHYSLITVVHFNRHY